MCNHLGYGYILRKRGWYSLSQVLQVNWELLGLVGEKLYHHPCMMKPQRAWPVKEKEVVLTLLSRQRYGLYLLQYTCMSSPVGHALECHQMKWSLNNWSLTGALSEYVPRLNWVSGVSHFSFVPSGVARKLDIGPPFRASYHACRETCKI